MISACNIIDPDKLARLMHNAAQHDTMIKEQPEGTIWNNFTFDQEGYRKALVMKNLVFTESGMSTAVFHR